MQTAVGLSDFRVDLTLAESSAPDRPLVAVLLDGPELGRAAAPLATGMVCPLQVLAGLMQWPAVERIWMPSWVTESDAIVEHLVRVVGDARAVTSAPRPLLVLRARPEVVSRHPPVGPFPIR